MSIQKKKFTSKKTGKTTTKYYAVVFDTKTNKRIWGTGRATEKEAKRDELELIKEIETETHIYNKLTFGEIAEQWFISNETNGNPISPDTYSKAFQKIIKKHNTSSKKQLPQMRLYDIRHSLATNLYASNEPVKLISEILEHSDIKTTLNTYAHISQTMHKQTLNSYASKILDEK